MEEANQGIMVFGWILWTIGAVLGMCCILQLFLVPYQAKKRGKDVGVWFIITVIWLFFNTILAGVAFVAGWLMLAAAVTGSPTGLFISSISMLVYLGILYLPYIALVMSAPKNRWQTKRGGTKRGQRSKTDKFKRARAAKKQRKQPRDTTDSDRRSSP